MIKCLIIIAMFTLDVNAQESPYVKNRNSSDSIVRRTLISPLNTSEINIDEDCTIVLRLKIDENGNIFGIPVVDKQNTTTTNQKLIEEVISIVINQVKYTPKRNSGIEGIIYTIRLRQDHT